MDTGDVRLQIETPPPLAEGALRTLFDYWRDLGMAAGGLPALADFDPLRLPHLLPNIWIVEVEPESRRFRMRLAGESINSIYRRNIGRKFFAEVFDASDMPGIIARYRRALTEPAVFYATGYVYAAAGQYCTGHRLGLPMLGSDGGTRILIGATLYGHRADDRVPLRPTGDTARFYPIRAANHRIVEIVDG